MTVQPDPEEATRSAAAEPKNASGSGVAHTGATIAGRPGLMAGAPVTRAFVWANVAAYLVELGLSRTPAAIVETPARVMIAMGANYTGATVAEHRYETLLTSCFLHFSVVHILFNLYALRQIGPPIERNIGAARMAPMVLVSGIVGSGVSTLVGLISGQQRLSAGASGAICGVIGAALVLGLRAEGLKSRLAWAMARWLMMLLLIQFVAQLAHAPAAFDNAAHFGGAATGGLFAAAWRRGPPYGTFARRVVLGLCLAVILGAFGAVAFRDTHDPFALLRADERYEAARALLRDGKCSSARQAIDATARLVPHAPEVLELEQEYGAACGPSM